MFKIFLKIFIVLAIFALIGWLIYNQLYISSSSNTDEKLRLFIIEQGDGLSSIAYNLKESKLINSQILFGAYIFIKGDQSSLQAGAYSFSRSMSIKEIADKIIKGETLKSKVTIIEGWNLEKIAEYFEEKRIVQKEDFLELANNPGILVEDFSCLNDKPQVESLEGYLFPDTYSVRETHSSEDIIRMMLDNLNKKITPDLRTEIEEQNKSIFEIIIMASLLEKEVRGEEDKKIVSGIFWKRIANQYPLQSCATIGYILGKDKWRYSVEDTKINSPYNTYQNLGLPIGPICNPGLESIEAAIRPEATKFWYYLSTPEGETIFSKTLHEHNVAKAKYLN
ncbi:MAG: endolytic transglycosylase MltG [Patescibacteria group bacterium]|nr:endolytic transglycosylase MltG [Patescibacteria group bacterium]